MQSPQLSPCTDDVRREGRERVSVSTSGRGWRRVDTIPRVAGLGRGLAVTVEYRHYGPLGWLFDALFRWLSKYAD